MAGGALDDIAESGRFGPSPEHPAAPGMVLRMANGAFRILEIGPDGCLIEAGRDAVLSGFADIYQNEQQMARCLIVAGMAEGTVMRCAFKRRTPARLDPPRDFA